MYNFPPAPRVVLANYILNILLFRYLVRSLFIIISSIKTGHAIPLGICNDSFVSYLAARKIAPEKQRPSRLSVPKQDDDDDVEDWQMKSIHLLAYKRKHRELQRCTLESL